MYVHADDVYGYVCMHVQRSQRSLARIDGRISESMIIIRVSMHFVWSGSCVSMRANACVLQM